jgi:hypothetical protein
VSLKKYKSQGKAVEVTLNSKEETLKTFVWIISFSIRPERFLDGGGKLMKEPDHFFPFSTGK